MNSINKKFIAKIPIEYQTEGIQWLVIEPHIDKRRIVGYYLFGHEELTSASSWDIWLQTIEDAFEAGRAYGIDINDWIEKHE